MLPTQTISLEDFWVIGINHEHTDTAIRGRFAVSEEQYEAVLEDAEGYGIHDLFILSTCNRTEIYGCTQEPLLLMNSLCNHTEGSVGELQQYSYQKNGKAAISHIFNVAAGLDSQILGDYEIIGQLKKAINFSKSRGHVGLFLDRLFSYVLQSCRAIRSKTRLSSGTVSVAYASVRYLQEKLSAIRDKKVLVIGLGKIGKNACKNLLDVLPGSQITLMNRTEETARKIAEELQEVRVLPFEKKAEAVRESDIIIVATGASEPVLNKSDLMNCGSKVLLDLSIPNNIDPDVRNLPGIILTDVDKLSKINDRTLQRRAQEIPKAKSYITTYIHKFAEWYIMRQNVPVLQELKEKLLELNKNLGTAEAVGDEELMQRIINDMAAKIKHKGHKSGCYYLQAMNGFLAQVENHHK